jgi:DNA-binding winged helix-turn-helix (wHTH) protein/tetratricopeptide (TPR) repeat protein
VIDRPTEVFEFGEFRLDVSERKLERRECLEPIPIPEKAFRTLVCLVRNSGSLVTKETILSTVWPDVFVADGNVGKVIHAVRRALGDGARGRSYIETVAKHGYRFVADVARIEPASAVASPLALPRERPLSGGSPAYDLYVRGKLKADSETARDADEAIAMLEAAVGLEPSSAAAYAQLARAYNTRAFKFTSQSEGKQLRENADVALAKALDLDPNLPEAHFARGLILWTKAKGFPHEHAILAFRKALELKPDADETHHQLSMVYSHVGLLDDALKHVRRAIELNPNNTMARFRVAVYTAWQCRFDDALAVLKTVPPDVSPFLVDRIRAEVYVQLGRLDTAAAIVDAYLDRHPVDEGGSLTSVRALLLAKAGKRDEAYGTIARAVELGQGFGHFHHTAYNIAAAHAALQEPDKAIGWLEAAGDDGFPCYPCFAGDPNLDALRSQPRFAKLMSRLQEQWMRFQEL